MNNESSGCGELQQLVQEEEGEEPPSRDAEVTPPSTPVKSNRQNKTDTSNVNVSQQVLWENNTQTSPIVSKGSSGHATTSQGSMTSGRALNVSNHTANQSRLQYLNEKEKQKPSRPEPPRINRQHRAVAPCRHHCFLSEVPDVRHMEQALLHLLDDFHSGNLRAFGKDCSMEQMTEIREQQERLARLHFELGQRQETGPGVNGEQSGLRQSSANMRHLLHCLQQLSIMTSFKKDVAGFFEEPTTYKHDFIKYPPQPVREMIKGYPAERIIPSLNKKSAPLLNTITSYDTLQKLNYKTRLPFDAMIKPKEIIGTHPQDTFCQRNTIDKGLDEAISTRPRLYVSPGISLDNVEDSETRRLMIDFTYMTTTGRAGKEAWSNFSPSESPCLPNTVFEKTVDPVRIRPQLISDIPIENKSSTNKQESKRERYFGDTTTQFLKNRENIDYEKRMSKLINKEEKEKVRSLIAENKLRLPYDRMPLSYGGFRPQLAIGVPLEINDLSPFDPNVSVSKAISAYNNIN